jgi:hypothetical protein
MREPSLVIENLSGVPGDERLVFRGSLVVPAGALGGWDAVARGVQVWVGDLGVPGGTLVEMTYWTNPVPPLGAALACEAPRDGWRVRGAGRVYIYRRGGRGREASSCRGTPAGGTVVVRLVDKRMRRGEVDFAVALRSTGLGMPVGPLAGTIVLGASAADGLGGRCATHTFTSCGLVPGEALFVCR